MSAKRSTFMMICGIISSILLSLIAFEIMQSSGKQTARITACIRYGATFLPSPLNGEIIKLSDSQEIIIGYDNYAKYFAFNTCKYILSSSFLRWILYFISNNIPGGGTGAHVVARHIIMDKLLINEVIENNAKQVVILGAGYDSRALRFENLFNKYDINVFEVDLPSTQFGKKSLLSRHNIQIPSCLTFVSVDFGRDDVKQSLKSNGYDETLQTVFIFEGVAPYLYANDVAEVMKLVSQFSGNNSLIVWDAMHRCFAYGIGLLSIDEGGYCKKHDMVEPMSLVYFVFGILKEPANFYVDWDINNEKSDTLNDKYNQKNYYHLLHFHRKNCLKTEEIYDHNKEQAYFEWKESNRTVMTVTKGLATVSARKIDPSCKPQPI